MAILDTVENVQKHSVQHPRCGTAFLLTVVILSIFLFAPLNVLVTSTPGWNATTLNMSGPGLIALSPVHGLKIASPWWSVMQALYMNVMLKLDDAPPARPTILIAWGR